MKKALFITGYPRSIKQNIYSIKKFILEDNDVDVFIYLTNDTESKYLNEKLDINFLYSNLEPVLLHITENIDFVEDVKLNNLLNQNYKLYFLNEQRKKSLKKYDVVIKIRPDIYLNSNIDFNINLHTVYIPNESKIDKTKLYNENDKYICDIIAYGGVEVMDSYFEFYSNIPELYEKYGNVNETLLYNYITQENIKYDLVDIEYIVTLSLCNTIAITGDSGSGKSTLSKVLKKNFNSSFVLECDRYHKWERGDKNWDYYTHLNPNSNYIIKMEKDVFNLKMGKNIYQVDYNHKNGKFTDKELIESSDVIIVCGLHALYISENILNLKIFMDTDRNLKIPWKIKRDTEKRGYSVEKILKQIEDRELDFNKYIYPQRDLADIIICLYTDKYFDLNSFSVNDNLNIYLKVGLNKNFKVEKIIEIFGSTIMKKENQHIFIDFGLVNDYATIVNNILSII